MSHLALGPPARSCKDGALLATLPSQSPSHMPSFPRGSSHRGWDAPHQVPLGPSLWAVAE